MARKKTQEQFLQDCERVHGCRYDYSLSVYKGAHIKLKIICQEHGIFEQMPANHINSKRGCPVCANKVTISYTKQELDYYLPKIAQIHENKYDLSDFIYTNSGAKGLVHCKCGGDFYSSVDKLTQGRGCPHCAKSGFKPNKPCYFYVLKVGDGALKCGITINLDDRLTRLRRKSKFDIKILYKVFFDDSITAKTLEDIIKNTFTGSYINKSLMKDGYTETFDDYYLPEVMRIVCKFSEENYGEFGY